MTLFTNTILDEAEEELRQLRAMYGADSQAKVLPGPMLNAGRHLIGDYRSVLDSLANGTKEKFGKKRGASKFSPYFPITPDPAAFVKRFDQDFGTLRADHPEVTAAFEHQQPYQSDRAELRYLPSLYRVNSHRDFTRQDRVERLFRRIEGGKWEWGPNVTFDNVSLDGYPIDPVTREPPVGVPVIRTLRVHWDSVDPRVPVLATLEALQRIVRAAAEEICKAAGL
jgi:hypothetical protein